VHVVLVEPQAMHNSASNQQMLHLLLYGFAHAVSQVQRTGQMCMWCLCSPMQQVYKPPTTAAPPAAALPAAAVGVGLHMQ
jgi:hypothetical protein